MTIVIIEAHVPSEKWDALMKAFKSGIDSLKLFPIAEVFLIQSRAEPTLWQIISVWYSWDDLTEARRNGSLPGEMIFVLVGAKTITTDFDVIAQSRNLWKTTGKTKEDSMVLREKT